MTERDEDEDRSFAESTGMLCGRIFMLSVVAVATTTIVAFTFVYAKWLFVALGVR